MRFLYQKFLPFIGLIGLLATQQTIHAQKMVEDYEVNWQDLKSETGPYPIIQAAFKSPTGYLIIKKEVIRGPGSFHYYLERRNLDFTIASVEDISQQIDDETYSIQGFYEMKDHLILLSVQHNRSEKSENLYAQLFDPNTMTLSERKEIFNRTYEGKRRKWGGLNIVVSDDKNYMAVSYTERDEEDNLIINYSLLDGKADLVSAREAISYPQGDHTFSIANMVISNDGSVFYLLRKDERLPKEKGERAQIKTTYALLKADQEGEIYSEILREGLTLENLYLSFNGAQKLLMSGYYRTENKSTVDGSLLFEIDTKTGEILNSSKDPFETELIKEGLSDRAAQKLQTLENNGADLGISNLRPLCFISHEDKTMSVVGEIFFITTHTTYNKYGSTTTTYYHYNDLIISRYNAQGELLFHNRIPKEETYVNRPRSKEIVYNHESEVMFVSVLHTAKFTPGYSEMSRAERKMYKGCYLAVYRVNSEGEESTEAFINGTGENNGKSPTNIDDCLHLASGELIASMIYARNQCGIALIAPTP